MFKSISDCELHFDDKNSGCQLNGPKWKWIICLSLMCHHEQDFEGVLRSYRETSN